MEKQEILLESGTNELEIAEFGLFTKTGKLQSFGINVAKVREIIKIPKFIKMPESHKDVIGVFNLRKKMIPLINLASWLDQKTDIPLEECFVIVTEFNQANFGFLIHKIQTIHRMSWKKVLPPSDMGGHIKHDCITGIVLLEDRIMMMVDFENTVASINPNLSGLTNVDVEKVENQTKKIFLAEDSSLIRMMVKDILEKGGYDVVSFNNGQVAWDKMKEIIEAAKEQNKTIKDFVQLVISDIEMPQMDGHSLLKHIKDSSETKDIPVILYSSLIYEEIRKKGEALGADAQISKPEFSKLLEIVKDVVNKKKE